MKKLIILLGLLFLTSCAAPIANLDAINVRTYFPNADMILAPALQPKKVICPKCKTNGYYVQSLILDGPSLFYSQYTCEHKHMWFIGQELIDGPVKQVIFVR